VSESQAASPSDPEVSELAHLTWLIGSWQGVGTGQYATIEGFRYFQELTISHDGRPFLTYLSRSWIIDDAGERTAPSAVEVGFIRPLENNGLELVLAHPSGVAEIWLGVVTVTAMVNSVITGARIEAVTDAIMRTETAPEINSGHRLFGLVDGDLLLTYDMAAFGQALANHLAARLRPVDL